MKPEPSSTKAHILLVEDDPAIRRAVHEYLELSGYRISEAETCEAARDLFRTGGIDAALVDYSLPDGNAIQLLKAFKALDRKRFFISTSPRRLCRRWRPKTTDRLYCSGSAARHWPA